MAKHYYIQALDLHVVEVNDELYSFTEQQWTVARSVIRQTHGSLDEYDQAVRIIRHVYKMDPVPAEALIYSVLLTLLINKESV